MNSASQELSSDNHLGRDNQFWNFWTIRSIKIDRSILIFEKFKGRASSMVYDLSFKPKVNEIYLVGVELWLSEHLWCEKSINRSISIDRYWFFKSSKVARHLRHTTFHLSPRSQKSIKWLMSYGWCKKRYERTKGISTPISAQTCSAGCAFGGAFTRFARSQLRKWWTFSNRRRHHN